MNPIKFHYFENDDFAGLTAKIGNDLKQANSGHPNWTQIVEAVKAADESTDLEGVLRLFDPSATVADYFDALSERVTVSGGHVFLDGDEVSGLLGKHIVQFVGEDVNGERANALINFLENVAQNPNEHSREQLYEWLSRFDFAINQAGNFLAYKGVRPSSNPDYAYESISSGRATVDGQVYSGAIPQGLGSVVEMPRSSVQHDPSVGCHTGLHAGTFEYANGFAQGKLLLVEINPRDVVSVPTDCSWAKIRTCRYTVVEEIEQELDSTYYGDLDEDVSEKDDLEVDDLEELEDDGPLGYSEAKYDMWGFRRH